LDMSRPWAQSNTTRLRAPLPRLSQYSPSRQETCRAKAAPATRRLLGVVEFVDNDSRYLESEMAWSLSPGDRIRRTELHARYGGRRQGGIGPSAKTPNVFIFTDRDVGKKHGYLDRWEGDTFLYVGEGQRRNQRMEQGNRGILEHVSEGRALRLVGGSAGGATHAGDGGVDRYVAYHLDRAPD